MIPGPAAKLEHIISQNIVPVPFQDWDQNDYSLIKWSGLKARELCYSDAVRKKFEMVKAVAYKSDIYVLALFKHQEHATLDILDIDQWCFYALSKQEIKHITKDGNSVSLKRLQKHNIQVHVFKDLRPLIKGI